MSKGGSPSPTLERPAKQLTVLGIFTGVLRPDGARSRTHLWKAWPSIRRRRNVLPSNPSGRSYARTYSYLDPLMNGDYDRWFALLEREMGL